MSDPLVPANPVILNDFANAALAACNGVLARIWLVGPGDLCRSCPMRPECPDQRRCLHLVHSAGVSRRLDGPFRRFPIGAREVGRVPETGEPFIATRELGALGLADQTWLMTHSIQSFAALPIADDACLGVLAVFAKAELDAAHVKTLGGTCRLACHALRGASRPADLRPWVDIERDALAGVLRHTRGVVSGPHGAARILELKPTTLYSRLNKLGVKRKAD